MQLRVMGLARDACGNKERKVLPRRSSAHHSSAALKSSARFRAPTHGAASNKIINVCVCARSFCCIHPTAAHHTRRRHGVGALRPARARCHTHLIGQSWTFCHSGCHEECCSWCRRFVGVSVSYTIDGTRWMSTSSQSTALGRLRINSHYLGPYATPEQTTAEWCTLLHMVVGMGRAAACALPACLVREPIACADNESQSPTHPPVTPSACVVRRPGVEPATANAVQRVVSWPPQGKPFPMSSQMLPRFSWRSLRRHRNRRLCCRCCKPCLKQARGTRAMGCKLA